MKKVFAILKMIPLLISISIIISSIILFNPIAVFVILAATSLVILAYFAQLFEEGWKELMEEIV
jgi:hypothetical protein